MRAGERNRLAVQRVELEIRRSVRIAHKPDDVAITLRSRRGSHKKCRRDKHNRSEEFPDSRMEFPIHGLSLAEHILCSKEIGRRESASRMLVTFSKLYSPFTARR